MSLRALCGWTSSSLVILALQGCTADDPVGPAQLEDCLGVPCSPVPAPVAGGLAFTSISAGGEHTCALTAVGEVYCWGSNASGQLGAGIDDEMSPGPVRVASDRPFTRVSSGARHTCALTDAGEAYCWGNGLSGALGSNLLEGECEGVPCSRVPVQVIGGNRYSEIEAGVGHTCGLTSDGIGYCWGANGSGELGNGLYYDGSALPELVGIVPSFSVISAGGSYTCGLTPGGEGWCWGSGRESALGYLPAGSCPGGPAEERCSPLPGRVLGELRFESIVAGDTHACGQSVGGEVYCWGANASGQLGAPGAGSGPDPVLVALGRRALAVSAGDAHTCAVAEGTGVYCWGSNVMGQLGAGRSVSGASTPIAVSGGGRFREVTVGGAGGAGHSCALTAAGAAYCWGGGSMGQLGLMER